MIRQIQIKDRVNCEIKRLAGLTMMIKMERFIFKRSQDYIHSFIATTVNENYYAAVFVNRKVQLYNVITAEFLFEINFPNAGYYCQKGLDYQRFYLFDND